VPKRYPYILIFCIALFSTLRVAGQMTMPDNVCIGKTKLYHVDPNPVPGSTYTWWIDGVVQVGFNTNEFEHTWNTGGTYLLEIQELSADRCLGPKQSGEVIVHSVPTPTFNTTQPTCISSKGTITISAPSGTGMTYSIDGSTYTNTTGVFALLNPGTYNVSARDLSGCVSPVSADIVISAFTGLVVPIAELSDYNGFNISCYGKSDGSIRTSFARRTAGFIFGWTGPDGFVSSEKDIAGLKAGEYILSVTDENGCLTSVSYEMREQLQLVMTIDLSISSDGDNNLNCAGQNTGFAAVAAINNTGATSYLWSDGYSGNNRIDIAAGNYKIIITDANNCSVDSAISVTAPAPIILSFETTQPICPDESDGEILLTVTGGIIGNDYVYNWSNTSHERDLLNIKEGLYKVTVSDLNGCSVRDSIQLDSKNETCMGIPNAISPNGDLINDTWVIEKIELYPDAVVKIFNNWGVTVWKSEKGYATPWDGRSDGIMLPSDSYFYIIDLHNGARQIAGSVTIIK